MANKIVQLENEDGDNLYPLAGGALTGSISKTMLEEGVFEGLELSEPNTVAYVAEGNIQDDAVTTTKIANNSVTDAKIDLSTLRDKIVTTDTLAVQGKALNDFKTQGVFMINYRPSDTPATDWVSQVGTLLVFYAWYDGIGSGHTAYFTQIYCVSDGTRSRMYTRQCTHKNDGTYTMGGWTLVGNPVTLSTTDIGAGASLAAGTLYGVYS